MTNSSAVPFLPVLKETIYRLRFVFTVVLLAGPAALGLLQVIPSGSVFSSVVMVGYVSLLTALLIGGVIAAVKNWQDIVSIHRNVRIHEQYVRTHA